MWIQKVFLIAFCCPTTSFIIRQKQFPSRCFRLFQKKPNYVRPSAAIERGSGFFVPGLEGPRVRLAGGSALLALVGLNLSFSEGLTTGDIFAQGLAISYGLLVLIQGVVEGILIRQSQQQQSQPPIDITSSVWMIPPISTKFSESVEWVADTILTRTAATSVEVRKDGKVLYQVGEPSGTQSVLPINDNMQLIVSSNQRLPQGAWFPQLATYLALAINR